MSDRERRIASVFMRKPLAVSMYGPLICPSDFQDERIRHLVTAMLELSKCQVPIDAVTVGEKMEAMGVLRACGGPPFLLEIIDEFRSAEAIEWHCRQLAAHGAKRRMKDELRALLDEEDDPDADPREWVAEASARVVAKATEEVISDGVKSITECINSYQERYADAGRGVLAGMPVPIGLTDFDREFTGIPRGELTTIAARSSVGKSALSLQIAEHIARNVGPVYYHSLEMSFEQFAYRMAAESIQVSVAELYAMKQGRWVAERVAKMHERFEGIPLYIDVDPNAKIESIRAKAMAIKAKHGLAAFFVDHLLLVPPTFRKTETRAQLGHITKTMMGTAKELSCAAVAVHQLNRKIVGTDRLPNMGDLKESGSVEENSAAVIFVHREVVSDTKPGDTQECDLRVGKFRGGRPQDLTLQWVGEYTRFRSAF